MITKKHLSSKANRPYLRSKQSKYLMKDIKGVVLHWTANTDRGATARANTKYFNRSYKGDFPFYEYNNRRFNYGSAHYIVDDMEIVEAVPPTEMAFHCGDTSYLKLNRHVPNLRTSNPNAHFIGIEICVNEGSNYIQTLKNVKTLIYQLNQQFNLPSDMSKLYRHYDISGKDCPKQFQPYEDNRSFDWNWVLFKDWLKNGDLELLTLELNFLKEELKQANNKIYTLNTSKQRLKDDNKPKLTFWEKVKRFFKNLNEK